MMEYLTETVIVAGIFGGTIIFFLLAALAAYLTNVKDFPRGALGHASMVITMGLIPVITAELIMWGLYHIVVILVRVLYVDHL